MYDVRRMMSVTSNRMREQCEWPHINGSQNNAQVIKHVNEQLNCVIVKDKDTSGQLD